MSELDKYCRACKSIASESSSDMKTEHLGTPLSSIYLDCVGIDIASDEFSRMLCQACVRALIFSYEFKEMCKKTQKELESALKFKLIEEAAKAKLLLLKEEKQPEIQEEPKNLRICDYCNEDFESISLIKKHMKKCHKEHKCKLCDSILHGSISLKSHMESNHYQKSSIIKCIVCDKQFSSKSVLTRHIRTVHEKVRKYSCYICTQSFKLKSHLDAHQSSHTNERPFKCEICSLSFKTEIVLKNHLKSHSIEASHICDICGSNFKSLTYLKIHQATHTDVRNFKCDLCDKSFKTARTMKDHKKTHFDTQPFDCHICGKSMKSKMSLNFHIKTHMTPGPQCDHCGKTFRDKYVLRDHIATRHELERKFKCKFEGCTKAYFTSCHLNAHVKQVHLGMQIRKGKSEFQADMICGGLYCLCSSSSSRFSSR
uniref:CSON004154 protein n=1 Tax=Culicoides sonorensis TaxID=179676 RepID=A0A336N0Y8_CULSO